MKNIFLSSKQLFEEIGKVVNLYKNLWRERTICLLHARRETLKTDRALDIALEVAAAGLKTLYVNVDRKIGQYADRLTTASSNLLFATPNFDGPDDSRDYADIVFELIEKAGTEQNKTAHIQLNWPQAVLRFHYADNVSQAVVTMDEANEGEDGTMLSDI